MPMTKKVQVIETVVYEVKVECDESDKDTDAQIAAIEAVVQDEDNVSFAGVTSRVARVL